MATREELVADRLALRNARTQLLGGTLVKQVERDGRKLVMATPTVENITDAIAELDRQIAGLDQMEDPTVRRRRALSVSL